ncbi:MAG: citrate lyase acyl carrier protein [Acholeplasmataceae bacterium]|jgi:citrate lyase subunit gamma (acyl carrier protein)
MVIILKVVSAGTLESNDCIITILPSDKLIIEVKSVVYDFFGKHIENYIKNILQELNITNIKVICEDKGALDYTIKARLLTAIERFGDFI